MEKGCLIKSSFVSITQKGMMMSLNKKLLGRRAKQYRKRRGYTQEEIAEQIDKTAMFIRLIESGEKGMSIETFVDLANALNVTADELLRDSLGNTIKVSNHDFVNLLSDCSDNELKILRDTLVALKRTLRLNRASYTKRE